MGSYVIPHQFYWSGSVMVGTGQFLLYRVIDDIPEIYLADEYFADI